MRSQWLVKRFNQGKSHKNQSFFWVNKTLQNSELASGDFDFYQPTTRALAKPYKRHLSLNVLQVVMVSSELLLLGKAPHMNSLSLSPSPPHGFHPIHSLSLMFDSDLRSLLGWTGHHSSDSPHSEGLWQQKLNRNLQSKGCICLSRSIFLQD